MPREAEATIAAAMGIEAWAARRRAPGVAARRVGIGARGVPETFATSVVVSIGLAGGLRADLPPGTVVVARTVALEDGIEIACEPAWVAALERAARRLGHEATVGPMLTSSGLVTGAARGRWAGRGFVGVDMESAHLAQRGADLAVVRVILDSPDRELSPKWVQPWRALLDPRLAREAAGLLPHSRRFALRSAEVLAEALRHDVDAEI